MRKFILASFLTMFLFGCQSTKKTVIRDETTLQPINQSAISTMIPGEQVSPNVIVIDGYWNALEAIDRPESQIGLILTD